MSLYPLSQPASSLSCLGSQILPSQSKELRLDGKPLVVTLDILESCYDLPLYAAAAKLGICITVYIMHTAHKTLDTQHQTLHITVHLPRPSPISGVNENLRAASLQAIKKVCRKLGVTKWPYREMRLQREGGAASAGAADPGELESDVGESSNDEDDQEGEAGVVDDGGSDHEEFSRVDSSGSAVGIQGWSVLMAAAHRISEEVEKQEQASLKAEKATAKEADVSDPPPPDPQQDTMAASVQTTTDADQEPQDGGPEPLDAST
jgi:hypothetical protein